MIRIICDVIVMRERREDYTWTFFLYSFTDVFKNCCASEPTTAGTLR